MYLGQSHEKSSFYCRSTLGEGRTKIVEIEPENSQETKRV
ncbi:hypothetical protein SAMN04488512_1306 [Sulfitobacter litoralis]|uniref:Uncharacterized protein n=1 Tax=Sulfitobacter litoralis TaxID=335975 RepID=A0ABY0SWX3_9RHOB|nr:hypothetical protein SAMN04488512_1306 [Sulfitobacter litoralis]